MSSALPFAKESRAQIRNYLDADGDSVGGGPELNRAELSEVYQLLASDDVPEEWAVHRIRKEVLEELSEFFDSDLRRDGCHHSQLNQIECWYLRRAIEEIASNAPVDRPDERSVATDGGDSCDA